MKKNMLGIAIHIAASAHLNQTDRGGNPYILHPVRVMMRLRTRDEELMQIAILHDVVEDSEYWTLEDLRDSGFSERVVGALECLTHRDNEPYEDYIERIGENIDAIMVKKEDLRDNSDITRLKGLTDKDVRRTLKYHESYTRLTELESNFR